MTTINILPIPSLKAYFLKSIYCKRLKPVDPLAVDEFKNYLKENLNSLSNDVLKHYNESINITNMLGETCDIVKSIKLYTGLTYQLPMSLYHLYINRGYRFNSINPYYCMGYILGDELIDEGIHVYEDDKGLHIEFSDTSRKVHVDPSIIYALRDRIIGFSYTVIDYIVDRGVDLKILELLEKYGEENYYYLCHLLIRRIGELMSNHQNTGIIIGFRLKELYSLALLTVNIFKNLIPLTR